ncbi:uncharacterized protein RCC_12043 [Ramularia collo-cygni]|uniref:F-box domain-containing protein n=1 Tax=Ramularia collo-cygni TaxID=112498 RepID=A0A2D3UMH4_9PEZI|nr:uncharacterized protein RCC_12043 [Ramularia collo-cygni]CZT15321.1 uncharacterized protein RCC_12043 [Ramularia collo-cygni]
MSMLTLPRELYLIVCSYLSPSDLSSLAGMSKDYYLSVQESLFAQIDITSFGKLVKLVATLMKPPVVSKISARQRLRWQSLSDAQLRERDVKRLNIVLDSSHGERNPSKPVNGELLSRCIGAISRGRSGVTIRLTLHGPWHGLLQQLQTVYLPDVRHLVLLLGGDAQEQTHSRRSGRSKSRNLWELCFSGSAFPDLQTIEFDSHHTCRGDLPATYQEAAECNTREYHGHSFGHSRRKADFTPFYGLKKMRKIRLQYNSLLNATVLESLFGSNIIPQYLTHLEIANCPSLRQTDLAALSMLLQRGLQLLQHLKLHLQPLPRSDWQYNHMKYVHEIQEHPDHHLCNVIREVGQSIQSLDLALPLVCGKIFVPLLQDPSYLHRPGRGKRYSIIPRDPAATLPARLVAQGYRYRRLICWDGFCQDGARWEDMQALASAQGEDISWEIISAQDNRGSWHVSGCLPTIYPAKEVLERQLAEDEQ